MYEKRMGWSCKLCGRTSEYGKYRLCGYERVCWRCVKENPIPLTAKTVKVTIPDFVITMRQLIPHWFSSFHLSPCGRCSLPSWQQPCWWCGYYPMGDRSPRDPKNFLPKEHWMKQMEQMDLFLHYASCRFSNCACPSQNDHWLDIALERAKIIQWPTGEEIYDAFGAHMSEGERYKLHPWHDGIPEDVVLARQIKAAQDEVFYYEWLRDEGYADKGGGNDTSLRWARKDLEQLLKRDTKQENENGT